MKRIFMFLFIVIMFFGIAGCPSNSDNPPLNTFTTYVSNTPQISVDTSGGDNLAAVPELATLILLGTGLVNLAVIGRKRFKK